MSTRPGINHNYANYLLGLGLGLIIGSLAGQNSSGIPKIPVIFGLIFMLASVTISYRASKKNGDK
jgi:hypothetical protein